MCATVKPQYIRDMTQEMKQAEMKLKASMPRSVTMPLSSTSCATGGSTSPSEPKKRRGSTLWIKHSIKRQG